MAFLARCRRFPLPTVREFRDAIVRAFDFLRTDYGFHVAADEYRALGPGFMGEPVAVDGTYSTVARPARSCAQA